MARLDLELFLDNEVPRVHIAGGLEEASRVEGVLRRRANDYAVDMETCDKPLFALFSIGVYAGAAFFVLSAQASLARSALLAAGSKAGIQDGPAG